MTAQRTPWKRSPETDRDKMSLPEGKTCGGCARFPKCNAMFGHIALDEVCDWSPSRFKPMAGQWVTVEEGTVTFPTVPTQEAGK